MPSDDKATSEPAGTSFPAHGERGYCELCQAVVRHAPWYAGITGIPESVDTPSVMCAAFGDDDVGKAVVNASGEEVGMVTAVEHGTARVKPDPGVTDSIKAALGWEGTSDETYPLQEESVNRVTGDEIRLSGELHGDTTTETMDTGRGSSSESNMSGGADHTETGRMDTSEDFRDDRSDRSDTTEIGGETDGHDESGSIGREGRGAPDRDVAGRRDEAGGRGQPDDRPIDDELGSTGSGVMDANRDERRDRTSGARGRDESPGARGRDESGEAMDPDVGDGDRMDGGDDEITDDNRDIHGRDTDSDDDSDRI